MPTTAARSHRANLSSSSFLEHYLKIRGTIAFSTFAGRKFVLASVRFPKPQNQLAVGSVPMMFDFCMAQPLLTIDRSRITGSGDGIKADSRMTNRSACDFPKQPLRASIASQACSQSRDLCDSTGQENMGSSTGTVVEPRSHLAKLLSEAQGSHAPTEQDRDMGRSRIGSFQRSLSTTTPIEDLNTAPAFNNGERLCGSPSFATSRPDQGPGSRTMDPPQQATTLPAASRFSMTPCPSVGVPIDRSQISFQEQQLLLQQIVDLILLSSPSVLSSPPATSVAHNSTVDHIAMRDGCLECPPSFPATMRLLTQDLQDNKLNELPAYVRSHVTSLTFPEKVRTIPIGTHRIQSRDHEILSLLTICLTNLVFTRC
jgi:hypothetical protein